jgi:hypothetical protein
LIAARSGHESQSGRVGSVFAGGTIFSPIQFLGLNAGSIVQKECDVILGLDPYTNAMTLPLVRRQKGTKKLEGPNQEGESHSDTPGKDTELSAS